MVSLRLRLKTLLLGLFCCLVGWAGFAMLGYLLNPIRIFNLRLEGIMYDLMFRGVPHGNSNGKLIIVDINDEEPQNKRGKRALLIERIARAGASVIGVDLFFEDQTVTASDDSLKQTIKTFSDRLVLAYQFDDDRKSKNESYLLYHDLKATMQPHPESWQSFPDELPNIWRNFIEATNVQLPFDSLLKNLARAGLAHVTSYNDFDKVLRRSPLIIQYKQGFYASLALEVAKRHLGANYAMRRDNHGFLLHKNDGDSLFIPIDDKGEILIDFIPYKEFITYAQDDTFGINFRGAIVLLVDSGVSDDWHDATPLSEKYPMWAIHASLVTQLLNRSFIRDSPGDTIFWSVAWTLLGMLWLVIFEYRFEMRRKLWLILLVGNFVLMLFIYLLLCIGIHIYVVTPALVLSLTYMLARKYFYKFLEPLSSAFVDVELLISKAQNNVYPVAITRSPKGKASDSFKSFLSNKEFIEALKKIKGNEIGVRRDQASSGSQEQFLVLAQDDKLEVTKQDLVTVGHTLFQALFREKIKRIYDRCDGEAEEQQKRLRLFLRIDADELSNLPWELLCDKELEQGFLVLDKKKSLIRQLQTTDEPIKEKFHLPLKTLVMISSPNELPPLNVEEEKSEIKTALQDLILVRDIRAEFSEKATLEELQKNLDSGIHIFHFIGHGGFDKKTQEGMLAFETENDGLNWIDAESLSYLLRKSQVKLVILNSCEGARASDLDAFTGVAQKLINVGLPAVIAMQFPIPDETAILFSKHFYSSLVKNFSLDEAIAEARSAILMHAGLEKFDWSIPVLLMNEPENFALLGKSK